MSGGELPPTRETADRLVNARTRTAEAQAELAGLAAQRRLLSDWGGLTYYGSENAELRLRAGEDRVVFLVEPEHSFAQDFG